MSKYYTPSIEEFHVGFEYEEHMYNSNKGYFWVKTEMNEHFDYYLSNTRVKYLDREDIESLRFSRRNPESNNKSSDYFKMEAPGTIGYWTEIDLDFRWGFKDVIIKGVRGNEEGILFRGIIKNKSELKRLLKQLNICT